MLRRGCFRTEASQPESSCGRLDCDPPGRTRRGPQDDNLAWFLGLSGAAEAKHLGEFLLHDTGGQLRFGGGRSSGAEVPIDARKY